MKRNNPISVYVEKRYPIEHIGLIEDFFEQANRFPGADWQKFSSSRGSGYRQGRQLALTLDYESDSLEVKAYIEESESEVVVSIGNSGFPFEPMLAKSRYEDIANKLNRHVQRGNAEQDAQPDAFGAG